MPLQKLQTRCRELWPGLAVALLVAGAAASLAAHYRAPIMLLALLLGMAVNFLAQDTRCSAGIQWVSRDVLRLGVALLGLKITLAQVQGMGWPVLALVIAAVGCTIGVGIVLARWMGFRAFFGLLSGGAVGICGASAAMAIAAAFPQHPQKDKATLFVVISVSLLSTLAMVLYPLLTQWLGLDARMAGIFLGASIHDVAQVVGAGYSVGSQAGDAATLVKLMRVAMLVPVIALAAWMTRAYYQNSDLTATPEGQAAPARPPLLPGFVVAFVVLVIVNSVVNLPQAVLGAGQELSRACLACAMAAIGIKTQPRDILTVGWKPVVLMVLETAFLAALVIGLMALLPAAA